MMAKGFWGLRSVVDGKKQCTACGEWVAVTEFRTRSAARGYLQPWCRPCEIVRNREAQQRARQARLPEAPHRCYLCGIPLSGQTATIDHVIPLTNGGTDDPSNCRWACRICNIAKAIMTPAELYRWAQGVVTSLGASYGDLPPMDEEMLEDYAARFRYRGWRQKKSIGTTE